MDKTSLSLKRQDQNLSGYDRNTKLKPENQNQNFKAMPKTQILKGQN